MSPTVHTQAGKYETERVVKQEWGVIMIDGTRKLSVPWRNIDRVVETIPDGDAP